MSVMGFSDSKKTSAIRERFDRLAGDREYWQGQGSYYYEDQQRYMRFLIPEKLRVLEIGCGLGDLLAAVKPSYGYARWNANVEFQDRLGTVGFPSVEEFGKNPYAGPRITYGEYLFGMHSIPKLLYGHMKGWVESSVYMSASHTPNLKGLVFLYQASGFSTVLRHLTAVTSAVFVLSLFLTALGWADLWRRPRYWWVPFLSLWGTWYAAYLYSVRLAEPFRHTAHVYPLLLFCLLWGGFQVYQWLRVLLIDDAGRPLASLFPKQENRESAGTFQSGNPPSE